MTPYSDAWKDHPSYQPDYEDGGYGDWKRDQMKDEKVHECPVCHGNHEPECLRPQYDADMAEKQALLARAVKLLRTLEREGVEFYWKYEDDGYGEGFRECFCCRAHPPSHRNGCDLYNLLKEYDDQQR